MCSYEPIHINTYHNTHNNIASRLGSTRIVFEYMPNTYLIHLKYRNWKRSGTVLPRKAYRRRTYNEVQDTTDDYSKENLI